jgi:glutamine synthetase
MTETLSRQQVIEEIRQSPFAKVKVAVTDMDGILRGKYLHKDKFLSAMEGGFGFCNVVLGWDSGDVAYDNVKYTGWHTGYPDVLVMLDHNTYRQVPWDRNVPFLLGSFVSDSGNPLAICPRQLLIKVIEEARSLGFEATVGMEFEWFNFHETPDSLKDKGFRLDQIKPVSPGMFGYSILRATLNNPFFNELMDQLGAFGVPLEGLHTETGPGVYEAAIQCSGALEAADRGVLFKTAVKEIAYKHAIVPTFMAKWNHALPGSSGHIHQSLRHIKDDQSAFFDASHPLKMSPIFESYLQGQMELLPEILPLFAPTVNSFKRLVEGFWAPTRVTWGIDNRTVAFRAIPGSAKSTRLESRVPGADVNPYLAVAGCLAAGLYGIKNKLKLNTARIEGNGYTALDAVKLPANLLDASEKMRNSTRARAIFGDEFVDHFTATRAWEWRKFQEQVTDWELKRYFEII